MKANNLEMTGIDEENQTKLISNHNKTNNVAQRLPSIDNSSSKL